MATQDFKRKLAAILHADVKGYSRLMGEDEEATVSTLNAYREVMGVFIQKHRGRVVHGSGDSLLAEFVSVVDAVQCAVEIQNELKIRNAELSEDRKVEFRIGINLGDVIDENEDLHGDGVNIAARIEGLAEGGGICISRTAFDQVRNKLKLGYEYIGEHSVKNIAQPVRVYRVLTEPESAGKVIGEKMAPPKQRWKLALAVVMTLIVGAIGVTLWNTYFRPSSVEVASVEKMAFPLPDKPSIAVLPFDNMSGDPEQEYFSDGITEDIIAALGSVPKLFVIARNSTFTYKGKPVKVQQVAEELGVRYVLEGSVRKSEDKVRITAQLIDALNGHHLWAKRYDRNLSDIFVVQDEITKKIITAMQVKLTEGEEVRSAAKGTNNLEAYLKYLQANELINRINPDSNAMGKQLAEEAVALDPEYASAYAILAAAHAMDVWLGASKSPKQSIGKAMKLLQKAIALDDSYAEAHGYLGFLYSMTRQHDKALSQAEKAIALNPNSAECHYRLGKILTFAGRWEGSIPEYERAIRLNPIPPNKYMYSLGLSYGFTGQYEEAITWCEKAIRQEPNSLLAHLFMAAVYSLSGRDENARAEATETLRIQPKFSLEKFEKKVTFKRESDREKILSALRKAGIPDKPPLPLPDKPSIAVLPFENMSDDPKQEYFSDGITEEIITALSKISDLFVIARNSTFTYKGKPVKVQQVARDLGVRYVLEGSVRRAGKKVRITAQLIDSTTGNHLWAERYDRELKDIFALQDEITIKILTALRVELTDGEQIRSQATKTENLDAYLKVLQGRDYYWRYNEEGNTLARKMAVEAISLDPTYPRAYALLAGTNMMDVWFRWSKSPRDSLKKGIELLEKAIALDPLYARGHGFLSHFYTLARQYDKAIVEGEKAISIDPNSADSYFFLGMALNFVERPDEAIPLLEKAIRLNPMPPTNYLHNLGVSYRMTERYDEAIKVYKKALKRSPTSLFAHLGLTITYSLSGHEDEARDQAKEVLKVNPRFSVDSLAKTLPYKNQATNDRFIEALRKAGLK